MLESQSSKDGQSATCADGQPVPHVRERAVGRILVVELHGEVDFVSARAVKSRIDALTAGRRQVVLMDLRPVTFIDCAGLSVLCRARRRVRMRGGRLALVITDPHVLRTLSLAGLSKAFDVHGRLDDALAAHSSGADGQPVSALSGTRALGDAAPLPG
ncbi:STAS domain-containing protein [Streptantibioticus ferralitis]|uniref:Anti-sigma factor antagonist n=1 Tax=Streptantibioticus ferralitis TaxID=236510 RepID=A0ABT5YTN4_9ACTN|nr:STAS domain-containing protein [Streptantibioticus ferralitis]MDF2254963.1 STAS domain-containing protein [Streptantibioticus ferralitis]